MPLFKSRRKTTRSPRVVRRGGDLQKLHIKVTSPRIVMIQVMRGFGKSGKLILALALLGMMGWGVMLGLRHIFIDNEEYRLQEIKLETNGHIDHARVVDVTGIDLDSSIFEIDTSGVEKQLLALPEVISSDAERRLPGTLLITLTERVPVAWIQSEALGYPGKAKGGILVDKAGVTFPCEGALWQTSRDLPVIRVKEADSLSFVHGKKMNHAETMRAIHLIEAMKVVDLRDDWMPNQVILLNHYAMEVVCHDGSRAQFGLYDHERQMNDFLTIREHSLRTKRNVEYVNLIPKKNIPVRFGGGPVLIKPQKKPQLIRPQQRNIKPILNRS